MARPGPLAANFKGNLITDDEPIGWTVERGQEALPREPGGAPLGCVYHFERRPRRLVYRSFGRAG